MLLRIFRATIEDGQQERFQQFVQSEALPLMRAQNGLDAIIAGSPLSDPNEFCLVMQWRDLDALKAFAGEDWAEPHIHPDEAGLVRDRALHHYHVIS